MAQEILQAAEQSDLRHTYDFFAWPSAELGPSLVVWVDVVDSAQGQALHGDPDSFLVMADLVREGSSIAKWSGGRSNEWRVRCGRRGGKTWADSSFEPTGWSSRAQTSLRCMSTGPEYSLMGRLAARLTPSSST